MPAFPPRTRPLDTQGTSSSASAASRQQTHPARATAGQVFDQALPWLVSLLFHAMIFLLMALIVWAVQVTTEPAHLPIAEARIEDTGQDRTNWSDVSEPDLSATHAVEMATPPPAPRESIDLLSEVADSGPTELSIIGLGAGASDDELAEFGLNSGGLGAGPSFFGLGGDAHQARRICYVVDRSASMLDAMEYVIGEVKRSINRLHRSQQYHVIFFNNGAPLEVPPRRFVHAIKEYKRRTAEYLDTIDASGGTDPIPAMVRAFALDADLIYFLTDGVFSDELVTRLRTLNSGGHVRIYTIAFRGEGAEALLRQIASENNGEYRHVSENDIRP